MPTPYDPDIHGSAEADAWYAEQAEIGKLLARAAAVGVRPRGCDCETCTHSTSLCPAVLTDLEIDIAEKERTAAGVLVEWSGSSAYGGRRAHLRIGTMTGPAPWFDTVWNSLTGLMRGMRVASGEAAWSFGTDEGEIKT